MDMRCWQALALISGFACGNVAAVAAGPVTISAAPMAVDDHASIDVGTTAPMLIDILANDTDADVGDLLTIDPPAPVGKSGIVTIVDSATKPVRQLLSYTLNANAVVGTDTFAYTISDGVTAATANVIVHIYAAGSNKPPVVTPFVAAAPVNQGETLVISVNDVAKDADLGDMLSFKSVTPTTTNAGTIVVDPLMPDNLAFQAGAKFSGNFSFSFEVQDNRAGVTAGTGTIAVNAPPVIQNQTTTLTVAPGAKVSDAVMATDPENQPLTYSVSTQGVQGTATVSATGAFDYVANAAAVGTDIFKIDVSDGAASATATVNVTITAAPPGTNRPPVAMSGAFTVAAGASYDGTVQAADADNDPLSYAVSTNPMQGTATIDAATGAYKYTANAAATGTDSFVVTVSDGKLTATATINATIAVGAPNLPPVATTPVPLSVNQGDTVAGTVIAQDPEQKSLTFTLGTMIPKKGTAVVESDGMFSYTAHATEVGPDQFSVAVSDGVNTVEVPIAISIQALAGGTPDPNVPAQVTAKNTSVSLDLAKGSRVVNGRAVVEGAPTGAEIRFLLSENPEKGTATFTNAATGAFSYTADEGAAGSDKFSFVALVNDPVHSTHSSEGAVTIVLKNAAGAGVGTGTAPAAGDTTKTSAGTGAVDPLWLLLFAATVLGRPLCTIKRRS